MTLRAGVEPVVHPAVGQEVRLGKLARKADRRNLRFAKYLRTLTGDKGLPRIPTRLSWVELVEGELRGGWGMMGNDRLGDCTCAGIGHSIQTWTGVVGTAVTPSDDEVEAVYWRTGTKDDGRMMLDVLNDVRHNSMGGHTIGAFAEIERSSRSSYRMVRAAVDLFGTAYLGLALPVSAQTQTEWAVTRGPDAEWGSWGGHAVNVVAYDKRGLVIVTWGQTLRMTWGFFARYCDEAYAIIAPDFLSGDRSPAGFDTAALTADLERITDR
jgi:hypothetical protein